MLIERKGIILFFLAILLESSVVRAQAQDWALEPIVVYSHPDKPNSTRRLLKDDLESSSANSIVEPLALINVDLQSRLKNYGIQTDFSLRGSDFQGVSVLLGGQRINDPQTGHHNSDIPLTQEDISSIAVSYTHLTLPTILRV